MEYRMSSYAALLPQNQRLRRVVLVMTAVVILIPVGIVGVYTMLGMLYVLLHVWALIMWTMVQIYDPQTQAAAATILFLSFLTVVVGWHTILFWTMYLLTLRFAKPEGEENRPTTRQMALWTMTAWAIIATLCLVLLFI